MHCPSASSYYLFPWLSCLGKKSVTTHVQNQTSWTTNISTVNCCCKLSIYFASVLTAFYDCSMTFFNRLSLFTAANRRLVEQTSWLFCLRDFGTKHAQCALCVNGCHAACAGFNLQSRLVRCFTDCPLFGAPLPSNRRHRRSGDCLEGKGENYQVYSVQYCVQQLCTVQCTHIWTD